MIQTMTVFRIADAGMNVKIEFLLYLQYVQTLNRLYKFTIQAVKASL